MEELVHLTKNNLFSDGFLAYSYWYGARYTYLFINNTDLLITGIYIKLAFSLEGNNINRQYFCSQVNHKTQLVPNGHNLAGFSFGALRWAIKKSCEKHELVLCNLS